MYDNQAVVRLRVRSFYIIFSQVRLIFSGFHMYMYMHVRAKHFSRSTSFGFILVLVCFPSYSLPH